jgi:hypothetical protein
MPLTRPWLLDAGKSPKRGECDELAKSLSAKKALALLET